MTTATHTCEPSTLNGECLLCGAELHVTSVRSGLGAYRADCTCGWASWVCGEWLDAARCGKDHERDMLRLREDAAKDVDATRASG